MMRSNNHKTNRFLHTLEESKQKIISNGKNVKMCFKFTDVSDTPTK